MNPVLRIILLLLTTLPCLPAFYKGTGHRGRCKLITSRVLGALYIPTHLIVATVSLLNLLDYGTLQVMEGVTLATSSISTAILFFGFELMALAYTVLYILRCRNNESIKILSISIACVSAVAGVAYALVIFFFAGDYINATSLFMVVPYAIYSALLFVIAKQNEPLPKPGMRQVLTPKKKK